MYSKEELEKRIFTENKKKWIDACSKDYFLKEQTKVTIIKNGILLPLKKIDKETVNGKYGGGVCDEDFNFVGGLSRNAERAMNYSCKESYKVDKSEIQYYDEKIIFGGVIISTFGHFILECLSRLWWVLENNNNYKIAFLLVNDTYKSYYDNFFKLLDINLNRIIYVKEPSQFKEIIVPDETMYAWSNFKDKYNIIYEKIMNNVKEKEFRKLYLTRSKFENNDCFNEKYFEDFFKKRGYEIISPEQYSIEEQIGFIKGADEVVCTLGTLSHLLLFAKPKTKLVILNRAVINPLIPQLIINQVKELNFYIIDVSFNFLPVAHNHGCFLLGPTKYWKEYLDCTGEKYSKNEMNMNLKEFTYDYLVKWCEIFSTQKSWTYGLATMDNFDVLNSLSKVLLDKPLSRKDFKNSFKDKEKKYKSEIENLTNKDSNEIQKLINENKKLKKELKNIKNSKSWKITAPLRKISKIIKKIITRR